MLRYKPDQAGGRCPPDPPRLRRAFFFQRARVPLAVSGARKQTNPPPLSLSARCARPKTDSACASLLNELAAAFVPPRLSSAQAQQLSSMRAAVRAAAEREAAAAHESGRADDDAADLASAAEVARHTARSAAAHAADLERARQAQEQRRAAAAAEHKSCCKTLYRLIDEYKSRNRGKAPTRYDQMPRAYRELTQQRKALEQENPGLRRGSSRSQGASGAAGGPSRGAAGASGGPAERR